jgi:hypothetical protein
VAFQREKEGVHPETSEDQLLIMEGTGVLVKEGETENLIKEKNGIE